jgi:PAS domain-containing protein
VLNAQLQIMVANPAICRMLRTTADALIGRAAAEFLGEVEEFRQALATGGKMVGVERQFPRYDLYVRTLVFPIPEEKIVAGIFVDLTVEWKQERELNRLKQEACAGWWTSATANFTTPRECWNWATFSASLAMVSCMRARA